MPLDHLGPYRLVRRLGRGGMGTVYEGVSTETGQPAAVKVLNPQLAEEEGFRERFEIEIETLKKLKHPNIVRLYGWGEQGEQLYYAMELVHGASLEDELQAGRRFTWRETTQLGIKLLRALKHAHDHGVIHRDLKPANLLLTPDGELKLADFGIARLFGNTRLTSTGGPIGTAEYMAPEQADGRRITSQCDLYSLGGVLFAMLAGRPPFRGTSILEVLQMHRSTEPPPVTRFAPDVPKELSELISRLLSKEPADRGANAALVARQLAALEHGLSLTASTAHNFSPSQSEAGRGSVAEPIEPDIELPAPSGDTTAPGVLPREPAHTALDDGPSPGDPFGATRHFDSLIPAEGAPGQFATGEPIPVEPECATGKRILPVPVEPTGDDPLGSPTRPATAGWGLSQAPSAEAPAPSPADPSSFILHPSAVPENLTRSESVLTTPGPPSRGLSPFAESAASIEAAQKGTVPLSADRFVTIEEDERRRRAAEADSEHRTPWIQVALLSAGLAGLIALGWYLLRPPSADALFDRIEAVAAVGQPQQLVNAEADINSFLARFPADPRAAKLKGYQEEIELVRLERQVQLQSRLAGGDSAVSPIQRDYLAAIGHATTDPDLAVAKLQALVDLYSHSGDASQTTARLLELARRQLARLRVQLAEQARQSLALIDASLTRAASLATTDPPAARAIYRGIVELYSDKPWAAERVSRAKSALEQPSATANSRQ